MVQKLLKLDDFSKVLVGYLYEKDEFVVKIDHNMLGTIPYIETVKGKKIGIVVALGGGIIGWSLCNTKHHDDFDKEIGLSKALFRANIASSLSLSEKESFYSRVPFTIIDLFDKMNLRSEKYFKHE